MAHASMHMGLWACMQRHRHGLIPILGQFQYLMYLDFREDSLGAVLLSSFFLPSFKLFFFLVLEYSQLTML